MTLDPTHERLADYLAGEMPAAQRRDFERELAADPDLAREARELGATQAMMRGERSPARRAARWPAAVRYAAVIVLAFGAGFLARSGGGAMDTKPQARPESREAAIARAYQEAPAESDTGRVLIALSRGVR